MTQPFPYPYRPVTPPPPPPSRSPWPRRIVIGAALFAYGLVALVIGAALGAAGARMPAAAPQNPYGPTAASELPASAPAASAPAASAPAREVPPAAATAPVEPFPVSTAFDNGSWAVGSEVAAGTYRSAGPPEGPVRMCYVDAKVGDKIVSQEVSADGPVRITVADGQTVKASGCQRFTRVGE